MCAGQIPPALLTGRRSGLRHQDTHVSDGPQADIRQGRQMRAESGRFSPRGVTGARAENGGYAARRLEGTRGLSLRRAPCDSQGLSPLSRRRHPPLGTVPFSRRPDPAGELSPVFASSLKPEARGLRRKLSISSLANATYASFSELSATRLSTMARSRCSCGLS